MAVVTDTALSNTAVDSALTTGVVIGVEVTNPSAAVAYVKLFDLAEGGSGPTLASADPDIVIGIPSGQSRFAPVPPWAFVDGLWLAATTEAGQGDTAPSVALVVQVHLG
jgi:hypothetical protein